ncbi:MAG: type II toxin-antitoxin system ParD family antitoxin [Candidatus Nitrotoga sp.]
MSNIERVTITMPSDMAAIVKAAVEHGDYASTSEVVRDALRDWTHKRSLRQQDVAELRSLWLEALNNKSPGVPADEVLERLERKYRNMADAKSDPSGAR